MTYEVANDVLEELTTLYSDQPTFDIKKMEVIVGNAIDEIIVARNYNGVGYSEEQITADIARYKSNIKKLAEYDFATFGAPYQTNHSENSTNRSWIDRNKLFAGIVALTKI